MTKTKRFGTRAQRVQRPCARCSEPFTPPELHPGRQVCPYCRTLVKYPDRKPVAASRQPAVVQGTLMPEAV